MVTSWTEALDPGAGELPLRMGRLEVGEQSLAIIRCVLDGGSPAPSND